MVQTPVEFVPEEHTDFIFAVGGKDIGWAAILALVVVLVIIAIVRRRRRGT